MNSISFVVNRAYIQTVPTQPVDQTKTCGGVETPIAGGASFDVPIPMMEPSTSGAGTTNLPPRHLAPPRATTNNFEYQCNAIYVIISHLGSPCWDLCLHCAHHSGSSRYALEPSAYEGNKPPENKLISCTCALYLPIARCSPSHVSVLRSSARLCETLSACIVHPPPISKIPPAPSRKFLWLGEVVQNPESTLKTSIS